ncbi:hypothetical protein ACHHYP_11058 [Achlya hypogyna]|uniref:Tc1-like transposase DDE domain-containing protein n=1 Tax=Achlya hypogyna TaxID=1202772 RepID=A0A1V9YK25_ACHHY|nr:hypothetical protein ACHHYP_11058 [Achlya hypogyna]
MATITEDVYDNITEYIRSERPRSLTKEERLDILRLHADLRLAGAPEVSATIARLLGRSTKVVQEVWAEYLRSQVVVPVSPPVNTNPQLHRIRIPRTPTVIGLVRAFIRARSLTRTRTVAKDIMALIVEKGFISYNPDNTKSAASCLRIVQLFLARLGFKRGKRGGNIGYRHSHAHTMARDAYVQRMMHLPPTTPIVYMDESYIHHHYTRHHDSLYDPMDDGPMKEKHKGRRMCFIAGIMDGGDGVGKLLGLEIFEGGKDPKNEPKDYHGMFNHTYFVRWLKRAMDAVEAAGMHGVVFVMDNAKYHKGMPADTPRGKWRKSDLIEACERFGVDVAATDLKTTIWQRLKPVVAAHVLPVVVSMARARGHDVIFTPPHHSDLQPIEMVWVKVKGDVGRQYTVATTFADVRERLDAAFAALSPSVISNCIQHCDEKLVEIYQLLIAHEDDDVEGSTSDDASDVGSSGDESDW